MSDIQECFVIHSQADQEQAQTYTSLTYESFLASIVWLSEKLRPHNVPFLSEGVRTYISRYVNRAKKIAPGGGKPGGKGKATGMYQATSVYVQGSNSQGTSGGEKQTKRKK